MFEAPAGQLPDCAGSREDACDVVVLNDFAHVEGGGSKVAILSAAGLARRGHRVVFLAAVGPADPLLAASGVETVCLGQHDILRDPRRARAALRGLWNPAAADALGGILDRRSPAGTVVHLHGWTKALSSSVVRKAADRGFAVVSTLHDYSAVCPNGGFFDYPTERICRRRPLSTACLARNCDSRGRGHKAWRVARQIMQERRGRLPGGIADFVCLSRTSRDLHAGLLPAGARQHFVRNPIDVPCSPPVEVVRNRAFVAIGRLAKEKGVLGFAHAAERAGVPASFVGDGYLRDAVRLACPGAEITGWLDADGVLARLGTARVLVFPSLWPESHGLAVLEAAARGVPALVSDACAARESVADGETGLLFRAGDLDDFARQLQRLQDDALVARLGHAAYEWYWAAPAGLPGHVDALRSVYGAALAAREARRV